MSGILIWSSRFSRGQKKFRSTQHSGLGGLPAALLFPWCGPLSIFIIDLNEDKEGLLSNLDLTPSSGRSLVHRMTESGFKIILTGWNSALSLRRWHLIKINVIPCVGSESIWFKSVRERQGWTATWDKMLEVFSSTLRLMLAGKVMESLLEPWTTDAFIKVWYPQSRRLHTISGTPLPDHTSRRKLTNPGMIKGQKKMRKKDIRTDQYFIHKRLIYDLHIGRSVAFFFHMNQRSLKFGL